MRLLGFGLVLCLTIVAAILCLEFLIVHWMGVACYLYAGLCAFCIAKDADKDPSANLGVDLIMAFTVIILWPIIPVLVLVFK